MNIDVNSWHYKAYRWTYTFWDNGDDGSMPRQTNLCQYLQRIVWMSVLIALLHVVFAVSWTAIQLVGIVLLPFGFRTSGANPFSSEDVYVRYSGLNVGGWQLYPYHLLLVVWFALMQWCGVRYHWMWLWEIESTVLVVLIGFVLVSFVLGRKGRWSKSDVRLLLRAWWQARKENFCPTVRFTTKPTSLED